MYTKQQHKNYNFFSPQKYCETSKIFCRYQKLSQNEFMIKKEFSSRGKLKQNVFFLSGFFQMITRRAKQHDYFGKDKEACLVFQFKFFFCKYNPTS